MNPLGRLTKSRYEDRMALPDDCGVLEINLSDVVKTSLSFQVVLQGIETSY